MLSIIYPADLVGIHQLKENVSSPFVRAKRRKPAQGLTITVAETSFSY